MTNQASQVSSNVSVPRELVGRLSFWLERANERSDQDIAELLELRAILANPPAPIEQPLSSSPAKFRLLVGRWKCC